MHTDIDSTSTEPGHVFLVLDSRFGVVSAALDLETTVTDLNTRALAEAKDRSLANPGKFRIQFVKLVPRPRTTPSEGGEAAQDQRVATDRVSQLMRFNAQMFDSTIRVLAQQNTALLAECTTLRQEVEEARAKITAPRA